jgi:hypothetical protein
MLIPIRRNYSKGDHVVERCARRGGLIKNYVEFFIEEKCEGKNYT